MLLKQAFTTVCYCLLLFDYLADSQQLNWKINILRSHYLFSSFLIHRSALLILVNLLNLTLTTWSRPSFPPGLTCSSESSSPSLCKSRSKQKRYYTNKFQNRRLGPPHNRSKLVHPRPSPQPKLDFRHHPSQQHCPSLPTRQSLRPALSPWRGNLLHNHRAQGSAQLPHLSCHRGLWTHLRDIPRHGS